MTDDAITRWMRDSSDQELLAISSGVAMGYTDRARAIAEEIRREREVELPPDLEELRKRAAVAESETKRRLEDLEAAQSLALARKLGIRLIVIWAGWSIMRGFGIPDDELIPFDWAIPIAVTLMLIVGYAGRVRTRGDDDRL